MLSIFFHFKIKPFDVELDWKIFYWKSARSQVSAVLRNYENCSPTLHFFSTSFKEPVLQKSDFTWNSFTDCMLSPWDPFRFKKCVSWQPFVSKSQTVYLFLWVNVVTDNKLIFPLFSKPDTFSFLPSPKQSFLTRLFKTCGSIKVLQSYLSYFFAILVHILYAAYFFIYCSCSLNELWIKVAETACWCWDLGVGFKELLLSWAWPEV